MADGSYDIKKDRRELCAPPRGRFTEVEVPRMRYLAYEGEGDRTHWTMLIAVPDVVPDADVAEARATAERKKKLESVGRVRLQVLHEGRSVQILHLGSFDDEAPTLARLHDTYVPERGLAFNGDHHEIYLSDPRRTEAAKFKTVLRQPVRGLDASVAAR